MEALLEAPKEDAIDLAGVAERDLVRTMVTLSDVAAVYRRLRMDEGGEVHTIYCSVSRVGDECGARVVSIPAELVTGFRIRRIDAGSLMNSQD